MEKRGGLKLNPELIYRRWRDLLECNHGDKALSPLYFWQVGTESNLQNLLKSTPPPPKEKFNGETQCSAIY